MGLHQSSINVVMSSNTATTLPASHAVKVSILMWRLNSAPFAMDPSTRPLDTAFPRIPSSLT